MLSKRRITFLALTIAALGCSAASPPATDEPKSPISVSPAVDASPPATVVEPSPPTTPADLPEQASVRPLHQGRVLLELEAKPEWGTGPIQIVDINRYHETVQLDRSAKLDALPPEYHTYLAMSVDLYGPSARLCTVELDALVIEAHMQYYVEFKDEDDDGHPDEVELDGDALWQMLPEADQQVSLVASFPADPRCDGALWARDSSLPPPSLLRAGDPSEHAPLLAEEHRRALESSSGKDLAARYRSYASDPEYTEGASPWSEISEGRRQVWVDEQGVARVVTMQFGSFSFAPCRWPGPAAGFVHQLGEGGLPDRSTGLPAPAAVFDADLDGRYEALILEDGGDFDLVHVLSETKALELHLMLPDNSWVWC